MRSLRTICFCCLFALLVGLGYGRKAASGKVYTTYMWHLDQPIYWPARRDLDNSSKTPTWQRAYDSIVDRPLQGGHPQTDVAGVFSKDDRVAIYQTRAVDSLKSVLDVPNAGAQMSYPGSLIDNVNSLAAVSQYGYSPNWQKDYAQFAASVKTSGGFPRLDLVQFPYHHPLGPLHSRNMYEKQLLTQQVIYQKTWGNIPISKGLFPAEMTFSERMIPALLKAGVEWVIVANNHISRAIQNYKFDPSGDNNEPPNKADQVNPPQDHWFVKRVDRGCAPNNAVPFSYRPHYAQYIDPDSNQAYKIIVVPSAMAESWSDSESCYGTNDIDTGLAPYANEQATPPLVLLAHDGDNAFSGGYSYYLQCVSQFVHDAASKGYIPTTVQQYLAENPVDSNDIVHVEDGAWINHDSDFGDPEFTYGWMGPLYNQTGFDIPTGWDCNNRAWAVITASQNHVDTAEQMLGGVRIEMVQLPQPGATMAEIAWHFHLVQDSGYLYYGCAAQDLADKPVVAANNAVTFARNAIASSSVPDRTPPSIWYLYRHPYNPGAYGMGARWKYKYTPMPNDFYVYTFIYDISGVSTAALFYRVDTTTTTNLTDRSNTLRNPAQFNLRDPGPWKSLSMTQRTFPANDPFGQYKFSVNPLVIADEYWVHLVGFKNCLIDYYVSAKDNKGNVASTDIFHVWVGDNSQ